MPEADADHDQDEADRRVFTGYGVASAVLGLLTVVAIVLGTLIWSGHRTATDDRTYQTRVMAAAADWTSKGVPASVMLSKPFAPAQLLTALANLLNSGTPTP